MKKWEKPEISVLTLENTKTDSYGSGNGNGNDNGRPSWCFCEEYQQSLEVDPLKPGNKGHDHGAWTGRCPCCDATTHLS